MCITNTTNQARFQLYMHVVAHKMQKGTLKSSDPPLVLIYSLLASSLKNLAVNNVAFQAVPAGKAGQEICD